MPEIIVKLGDSIVQKNIFVKESIRIGRVPDNEIMVENLAVSRYHAVIEYEDGRHVLSDLDSSNGTFVNGVRIKKTELQDRDVITIGKHKLYFYDQRAAAEIKPRPAVIDVERTMMIEAAPAAPSQAELEVVKGRQEGTRFVLGGAQTAIGKGAFNDIQLTDWFVSKMHAVIERRGSEFFIRDLGSWRHTFVNGIMTHELPLADGDTIQLGPSVQLTFKLVHPEPLAAAVARVPVELDPKPLRPTRAPEPFEELSEATANSHRPRYVEWRDPEEPAAAPQNARDEGEGMRNAECGMRIEECEGKGEGEELRIADCGLRIEEGEGEETPENEDAVALVGVMHLTVGAPDGMGVTAGDPAAGTGFAPEVKAGSQVEVEIEVELEAPPTEAAPAPNRVELRRSALEELERAFGLDAEPEPKPEPKPEPDLDLAPENEPEPEPEQEPEPEPETEQEPEPEPIKIWTRAPEEAKKEPELEPEEFPWETPEEIPATAPEALPTPRPETGEEEAGDEAVQDQAAPAEPETASDETDPELLREIVMWERALGNKNPIIRKQAARQLQKLTGKEYDYS